VTFTQTSIKTSIKLWTSLVRVNTNAYIGLLNAVPLTLRSAALPRAAHDEDTEVPEESSSTTEQGATNNEEPPIEHYDQLSAEEVRQKMDGLSVDELYEVREYEKQHENRAFVKEEATQEMREINGERIARLLISRLAEK
jgi:hypothetical protein